MVSPAPLLTRLGSGKTGVKKLTKKIIVVADDQPGVRSLLSEVLRKEGFALLEAGSGEEAIEIMAQQPVDLIFLDVKMPRLDGVSALQKILEQPHSPPVVMMTAQGQDDLKKRVMGMGAAAYLEKPFDIGVIMQIIEQLV